MRARTLFFALLLSLAAAGVHAEGSTGEGASTDSERISYQIGPQPLSSALEAYAEVSGVQILYDRPIDSLPWSAGVVGLLSRNAALEMLLANSGLRVRLNHGARDIVLEPSREYPGLDSTPQSAPIGATVYSLGTVRVEAPPILERPPIPDQLSRRLYTQMLEHAISDALLRNPKTRASSYLIGVKVWVAPSGCVRDHTVFSSSGDDARDDAIAGVLNGVTLKRAPPTSLPQPFLVWIRSHHRG